MNENKFYKDEVVTSSKELIDLLEKFKDAAIEDFLEQSEGSYKNYKNLKEQILTLLKASRQEKCTIGLAKKTNKKVPQEPVLNNKKL